MLADPMHSVPSNEKTLKTIHQLIMSWFYFVGRMCTALLDVCLVVFMIGCMLTLQ